MINYLKGIFNKILKIISLCYTEKFSNTLLLGIVQEILSFKNLYRLNLKAYRRI